MTLTAVIEVVVVVVVQGGAGGGTVCVSDVPTATGVVSVVNGIRQKDRTAATTRTSRVVLRVIEA